MQKWILCGTLILLTVGCGAAASEGVSGGSVVTPSQSDSSGTRNWPNWMGPNLNGVSTESGWSTDWPEEGLPVAWTHQLGTGFSSVSIADGLLYSMGHTRGRETVWCLDAESGEVVWKRFYDAELNPNLYEGGPGSTPTIDDESVYSLSVDGRLMCLNRFDGSVVWEKKLQTALDVGMHEWGFNGSPFILGDQLILEAGRVVSFDKRTGNKLWQSGVHRAGYGSVRAMTIEGRSMIVSLDCDGLRVSSAEDGSEIAFNSWQSPFRTNSTTPIVNGDRIFISTGYQVGCGLFQLASEDSGFTLRPEYTSREMRNHFNNCILHQGYLYGFDGNSNLGRVVTLKCIDFATGEVQWSKTGLGCGSLMIADQKLVILSDKGQLVVADASPDGFRELCRSPFLDGRCWTVPVLLNGRIYGRNARGRLVCVRLPSAS